MGHEQAVEKLEQLPRHAEAPQAVDEPPLVDALVEELSERGRGRTDARCLHTGGGDVVERLARPLERGHEVLLVEPGPLVELLVFSLDEPVQLDGQEQLEAHGGGLQELVVEHRPDHLPHSVGRAVDQVRLVEPIHDHDDALVAGGREDSLKLREQFVAIVAAGMGGQRLAGEIDLRESGERPGQLADRAIARPHAPHDPPGEPGGACPAEQRRNPGAGGEQPRPPLPRPAEFTPDDPVDDRRDERQRSDAGQGLRPEGEPRAVAGAVSQPPPPRGERLGGGLVVTGGEQGEVAGLRPRELRLPAGRLGELRHELSDGERENRVHVVPELPLGEHAIDGAAGADAAHEPVEERIEVVVEHDEHGRFRMDLVVPLELPHHLQLERRLARPLLAKHDRRAGVGRIAVDFVPRRMERRLEAGPLEDGVVLRVFLGERVARDAVVFEKGLDFHLAAAGTMPSTIFRKPSALAETVADGP